MDAKLRERGVLDESRSGLVIDRLREGRARWKRKCQATKEVLQAQRVRIRDLQAGGVRWPSRLNASGNGCKEIWTA